MAGLNPRRLISIEIGCGESRFPEFLLTDSKWRPRREEASRKRCLLLKVAGSDFLD
jgi:hypothetical protein